MNLQELREKMDEVDGQLVQLIEQRMDIAGQIADYKKENHLPVLDAAKSGKSWRGSRRRPGPICRTIRGFSTPCCLSSAALIRAAWWPIRQSGTN